MNDHQSIRYLTCNNKPFHVKLSDNLVKRIKASIEKIALSTMFNPEYFNVREFGTHLLKKCSRKILVILKGCKTYSSVSRFFKIIDLRKSFWKQMHSRKTVNLIKTTL